MGARREGWNQRRRLYWIGRESSGDRKKLCSSLSESSLSDAEESAIIQCKDIGGPIAVCTSLEGRARYLIAEDHPPRSH